MATQPLVSSKESPRSYASGRWLTLAFFVGSILLLLGERMAGPGTTRLLLDASGLLLLVLVAALRGWGVRRTRDSARHTELILLLAHLGGLVAVGLHFMASRADLVGWGLCDEASRPRVIVVLQVAWVILWVVAALVTLFVDRAYGSLRRVGVAELGRVREALRAGLEVALAAAFLVTLNYLAANHDPTADFSYFRTAKAGEATRQMVAGLTEPVEVLLFFPTVSEVAEQLREYLKPLQALSPQLRVRFVDRLINPADAKKYEVRADGTLVVARGERTERLLLGTELSPARSRLRQLDGEFQQRLQRMLQPERVAYFTVGHGERATEEEAGVPRPGLKVLKELLLVFGYQSRTLGLASGLGSRIPDDAGIIILVGPRSELLPEESQTLTAWFAQGGRLLVALDPEGGQTHDQLVWPLGVRFEPAYLVADGHYIVERRTPADMRNLATDIYSSHAAISALSRLPERIPTAFFGAGRLVRGGSTTADTRIDMVVRALPEVWPDANGNLALDPGEQRGEHDLVAAVERPLGTSGAGQPAPLNLGGPAEARAVIMADADALTDRAMAHPPNQLLAGSLIRWLAGQESISGEIASEEDVPVQHTRKGEAIWFYGTVFAGPALVLALGFGLRWRRRPR